MKGLWRTPPLVRRAGPAKAPLRRPRGSRSLSVIYKINKHKKKSNTLMWDICVEREREKTSRCWRRSSSISLRSTSSVFSTAVLPIGVSTALFIALQKPLLSHSNLICLPTRKPFSKLTFFFFSFNNYFVLLYSPISCIHLIFLTIIIYEEVKYHKV